MFFFLMMNWSVFINEIFLIYCSYFKLKTYADYMRLSFNITLDIVRKPTYNNHLRYKNFD